MIFYFTGTGNSLFAARRLLMDGETLINIAEAMQNKSYDYTVQDKENVGLVFPVYFYTVPSIIEEFISKINVQGAAYVYAVITCGGGISQAGAVLKKKLKARGLELQYVTPLLMPDNSMLFYQIPPSEEGKGRLLDAEVRLGEIKNDIISHKQMEIGNATILSNIVGAGYHLCNKTAKFYANENCIGCGLCERNCPQKVITLKAGKPQWTKETCSKCSACINRCPKQAIQYGKSTTKRNRYVNPEI